MNYSVFQLINNLAGKWSILDELMIYLSKSAIILAVAIVCYFWFQKNVHNERKYTAFYMALTSVLALGINAIIHLFYFHPRPFVGHDVNKLIQHSSDSSFVSDHGTLVFSIAIVLFLRKDRLANIALLWATLVGLSRIYVGVHYPADIIGSFLLAGVTASIVIRTSYLTEPIIKFTLKLYDGLIKNNERNSA